MTAAAHAQPPIDVTNAQWRLIRDVLRTIVPDATVWAFGSRATGRAKPFSDLDLAVLAHEPLDLMRLAQLREAFSESDLPWRVDVVDWAVASGHFRRVIERDRVLLQAPGPERAHAS